MGLDNIPATYPCAKEGTAVLEIDPEDGTERIGCDATIAAGACPWKREMGDLPGAVHGMFGVPCWYRGKVGNWMLNTLSEAGEEAPFTFYGENDALADGIEGLSSEMCIDLSSWMGDHAEQYARLVGERPEEERGSLEDAVMGYRYAVRWLEFVGKHADGSDVWY